MLNPVAAVHIDCRWRKNPLKNGKLKKCGAQFVIPFCDWELPTMQKWGGSPGTCFIYLALFVYESIKNSEIPKF
jgi:hypothetical protein